MRGNVIVFGLVMAAFGPAAQGQGITEKQPVNHPPRGAQAGGVPAELRQTGQDKVVIPELTEIRLTLRDNLKSNFTPAGAEVIYQVAQDVYGPGPTLLLTKGTAAVGHVIMSRASGPFGEAGKLFLTADYVLAKDKTRIPLRAVEERARGGDKVREANAAGFVAGAATAGSIASHNFFDSPPGWWPAGLLVGPIVAAIIPGKNVALHPGQIFVVHTESDVAVSAPLPYADAETIERAALKARIDLEEMSRRALLCGPGAWPVVHLRSGDLWGTVVKDPVGGWATIYGPLGRIERVRADEIVSVEAP